MCGAGIGSDVPARCLQSQGRINCHFSTYIEISGLFMLSLPPATFYHCPHDNSQLHHCFFQSCWQPSECYICSGRIRTFCTRLSLSPSGCLQMQFSSALLLTLLIFMVELRCSSARVKLICIRQKIDSNNWRKRCCLSANSNLLRGRRDIHFNEALSVWDVCLHILSGALQLVGSNGSLSLPCMIKVLTSDTMWVTKVTSTFSALYMRWITTACF